MIKRAFTLIELMIVIAIISFLAMVSVPTFTRFLAKAKTNLGPIVLFRTVETAARHCRYPHSIDHPTRETDIIIMARRPHKLGSVGHDVIGALCVEGLEPDFGKNARKHVAFLGVMRREFRVIAVRITQSMRRRFL